MSQQLRARPRRRAANGVVPARRCERGQQAAARVVVDRPAVVRVDQAQVPHLGALVEVGQRPGRSAAAPSGPGSSDGPARRRRCSARNASRSASEARRRRGPRATKPSRPRRSRRRVDPGGVHLGLLGRLGHEGDRPGRRRSARRPPASGRAGIRRCGPASRRADERSLRCAQRSTAAAQASGSSDSTLMRARTSPLRLVSWVDRVSIASGHCSAAVGHRLVELRDRAAEHGPGRRRPR